MSMQMVSESQSQKTLERRANQMYEQFGKPFFDLLCAMLLLLVSSPIFLIIAWLIKLDSPGPVIFKQARIGKDGREFQIYKFRTMYIEAPQEGRSPTDNSDPRVTKLGRFIRKTSLDELPQVLNILRGDMSFIGPRPEQKSIVEEHYTAFERQRFLVKPGLTGLWQISEHRKMVIHEHLEHDFRYIEQVSLWLDVKILCKTVYVIFNSNTH